MEETCLYKESSSKYKGFEFRRNLLHIKEEKQGDYMEVVGLVFNPFLLLQLLGLKFILFFSYLRLVE